MKIVLVSILIKLWRDGSPNVVAIYSILKIVAAFVLFSCSFFKRGCCNFNGKFPETVEKSHGVGLLLVVWSWSSSSNQRNHEKGKLPPNFNPFYATIRHTHPWDDCIFQHDNDSKHTSNVVKNYLQNQRIEVLP